MVHHFISFAYGLSCTWLTFLATFKCLLFCSSSVFSIFYFSVQLCWLYLFHSCRLTFFKERHTVKLLKNNQIINIHVTPAILISWHQTSVRQPWFQQQWPVSRSLQHITDRAVQGHLPPLLKLFGSQWQALPVLFQPTCGVGLACSLLSWSLRVIIHSSAHLQWLSQTRQQQPASLSTWKYCMHKSLLFCQGLPDFVKEKESKQSKENTV